MNLHFPFLGWDDKIDSICSENVEAVLRAWPRDEAIFHACREDIREIP
jgi:hypothetical protein